MNNLTLIVAITLILGTLTAHAVLGVGDPAPRLHVARWVQGDPIERFEINQVYIVEFWATWCGPCIGAISHLNELHQNFRDQEVTVIGQNVLDYGDDADERVERFVQAMGDKMTYRIALDDKAEDKKGAMRTVWMEAASERGIPTTFVVNKEGRIAWVGHPMSLTEQVVEEILEGKFDIAAYARSYAEAKTKQEEYYQSEAYQNRKRLNEAMNRRDWETAEAVVTRLENALPEDQRHRYGATRVEILLGRRDFDAACELAESLSSAAVNDKHLLNELAWRIATTQAPNQRSLALARRLAERANELTQDKSAAVLDTLARVQFLRDERQEAIATQERALGVAEEYEKYSLEKTLHSYRNGRLPETH